MTHGVAEAAMAWAAWVPVVRQARGAVISAMGPEPPGRAAPDELHSSVDAVAGRRVTRAIRRPLPAR